jgi:hypothetical protein
MGDDAMTTVDLYGGLCGPVNYCSPGALGTVYRNTVPAYSRWADNDMMAVANGAYGIVWPIGYNPPHPIGIFGVAQAFTGNPQPALYAAHNIVINSQGAINSAVCRTIRPRDGMPKPGIAWDCLDIFAPLSQCSVFFTLEPTSLKYCGCCTLDTNTTLYAIDDESGGMNISMGDMTGSYCGRLSTPGGRSNGYCNVTNVCDSYCSTCDRATENSTPWWPYGGYTPSKNQGMLWAFTDCLAKKGPVLKTPADKYLVGADPVTGRNQQIDLTWEQLCLSTLYELDIAKDAGFTLRIVTDKGAIGNSIPQIASSVSIMDLSKMTPCQKVISNGSENVSGSDPHCGYILNVLGKAVGPRVSGAVGIPAQMQHILVSPPEVTSPATWLAPGALPEAGAIYYWRIRSYQSATGQIAWSNWSDTRSFTVKAGFIVNTPYYGVQLLSPNNGCLGCKTKPASFSWSPWKEATKYQFDLSKDPEFKQLVVTATTTTTGYEYQGTLDYSTNYFWRVKALEVNNQNIPSDWSATFSFQTEPAPAPPAPPPAEPATPLWVWVIIAIGAILVIVTLILIFKTRRV